MLVAHKLNILSDLVNSASKEELIWMNGYLTGILAQPNGSDVTTIDNNNPTTSTAVKKITVLYGTETGNAKKVATDFASLSKAAGVNAKLISLDQYKLKDFSKEEYLFIVISTQGDGEPPVGAKKFYDFIHQETLALQQLKFAVLALGDSSYPLFCKAGEDVYNRLIELGATALSPLEKSDVDFVPVAKQWGEQVIKLLSNQASVSQHNNSKSNIPIKTGKHFYKGVVQQIVNLNDKESSKQTYHIEIEVEDSNIYAPGDSLGILPVNDASLVNQIVELLELDPTETIQFRNENYTISNFLSNKANIVYLSTRVIQQYAAITKQDIPSTRMGLLELLKIYPTKEVALYKELITILEPNAPRLYSISSSPNAHEGEIHITVALDQFNLNGEKKTGLCSTKLSNWTVDQEIEFYIQPNHQFKLPKDDRNIILIGPGTGIAPFRSFLWERDFNGAQGKNWLFFGEQHFVSDFLYQTEIQNFYQTGLLTQVDLAFSRDQSYKIYVQHKILEKAKEFWGWIQDGSLIYVCGSKSPMCSDVLDAIQTVIKRCGGKTNEEAIEYMEQLKQEGRILLDVY